MWLHVAEVCSSLTFTDWIQAPKLDSVKLKPLPDKAEAHPTISVQDQPRPASTVLLVSSPPILCQKHMPLALHHPCK
ncbi:hypothetical protein Y1Q_0006731 [Alligator mississippiensis]|uniref:Uncharacterized protein n=1 Tax=Alligator mississippiensis TaxID=8496 RepID=A0A151NSM6_ALLMI|nr:hypothetical protein Y1Q_0006731 [Alligator mississippiensis]